MSDNPLVRTFDSFDQFMEESRKAEGEAMKQVLPQQLDIGGGDHVMFFDPPSGLPIFGYIYTMEEFLEAECRGLTEKNVRDQTGHASVADYRESMRQHQREMNQRGYRRGIWYSQVDPYTHKYGEVGDNHIVKLWRITEEEFNEARENDWIPSRACAERVAQSITEALNEQRREQRSKQDER